MISLGGNGGGASRARPRATLICGGLGGARLAPWLAERTHLTVIVGVGDDLDWYGLRICPDLDAVLYALAGIFDHERGYAIAGDTFVLRDLLARMGMDAWFNVGDRDLATHVRRTALLEQGFGLTQVTARLATAHGVDARLLPVTDDPLRARIRSGSSELSFQEFFVRDGASGTIDAVRWSGSETARPASGVLDAIETADMIVIGESSPVASILPVLEVSGVRDALARATAPRLAIAPMVMAERPIAEVDIHHWRAREAFMAARGMTHDPAAVAAAYAGLIDTLVLDRRDFDAWQPTGVRSVAADLLDRSPDGRRALVDRLFEVAGVEPTLRSAGPIREGLR